jgi:serine/threonine-protein kinase
MLAALAAWGWLGRGAPPGAPPTTRLTATLPPDHRIAVPSFNGFPLAVSPDGRALAYVGELRAGTQLYVRELESFTSRALSGTEGARQPFFSPDGQWVGYFARNRVHRVRVSGGAPVPVADVEGVPAGGAWGPDDRIVFATDTTLWWVGIEGGAAERVPLPVSGVVSWPRLLPASAGGWSSPSVLVSIGPELYAVSVPDGEAQPLGVSASGHGLYVQGYLVYTETTLGVARAVPFDVASLQPTGSTVSVAEDIFRPNFTDATLMALSSTGTLVYVSGTSARRLVLVDRTGRETVLPFEPGPYRSVAVSPDGLRILADRRGEPLRLLDLATGGDRPVAGGTRGVWSPDGRQVLVRTAAGVARAPVAPGAEPIRILEGPEYPAHWGSDGTLLFFTLDPQAEMRGGLRVMRLDADEGSRPLLDTDADERWITRSPDGRWIAYTSDLSGRTEVYVREFGGGEARQVSLTGSEHAVFSRSGDELLFLSGERMYAVPSERLDGPGPLEAELLFEGSYVVLGPSWDVRPQGDFVMVSGGPSWLREIHVVQGLTTELDALFEEAP